MKHLQFVLVLAIAVNVWECGDAKFGERGEMSPRRRRCYDGSLPKRLKKRERKVLLDGSSSSGGDVCHRLYPRVSCCPTRRAAYQILHRRDARVGECPSTAGHFLSLNRWDLLLRRPGTRVYSHCNSVVDGDFGSGQGVPGATLNAASCFYMRNINTRSGLSEF